MTRALVSLCLLVVLGLLAGAGGPRYTRPASSSSDPGLIEAERLWTAAASEPDPAKATTAWEAAAAAFVKVTDAGTVSTALQAEAAYAAILAWKNALNVEPRLRSGGPRGATLDPPAGAIARPQVLDAREQALLHAMEVYLRFAPPADEVASIKFLRANILRRRDHVDEAIAGFSEILDRHPDHEVAEYAANLLLDTYNRAQRHDDLVALADRLRADKKFLAGKPDLAAVVDRIHVTSVRKQAERQATTAREEGDVDAYDRCGEIYLGLHAEPAVDPDQAEELLYNAAVCFEDGGSVDRAVAAFRELVKRRPRSKLAGRSLARLAVAEARVGHYREAAEALEHHLRTHADDAQLRPAASDAVLYALAVGDQARAGRVADLVTFRLGARAPGLAIEVELAVIEGLLAAGNRKDAARRARAAVKWTAGFTGRDSRRSLRVGRVLAGAACPVAPVDELCPRPRDKPLVAAARRMLAAAVHGGAPSRPGTEDAADLAALVVLELDLEVVLATSRPTAAAVAAVEGGLRQLIAGRFVPTRIAAHARLGTLFRRLGEPDQALVHLRACLADVRTTTVGIDWLARCERDLVALKAPDGDPRPEHLGPAPLNVPMSIEGPSAGSDSATTRSIPITSAR